jgi:hypothetical protein
LFTLGFYRENEMIGEHGTGISLGDLLSPLKVQIFLV